MKSDIEKIFQNMKTGESVSEEMLVAALEEMTRLKRVIHAARETRKAQEMYYRNGRTQTALKASRGWEKELDKALSELWAKNPPASAMQEPLL